MDAKAKALRRGQRNVEKSEEEELKGEYQQAVMKKRAKEAAANAPPGCSRVSASY